VTIRIWHQSITDISRLPGYAQRLASIGTAAARNGTTITIHGVAPGSYPEGVAPIAALRSAWAHHLLSTQVILGAITAAEEGYDAVTISCFFDPGLREAREMSGIPVVSACESAVLAATSRGALAGLIALDRHQALFLRRLVAQHGLTKRVASIVTVSPEITEYDLEGNLSDDALLGRMEAASIRAVADGAGIIVPAEGVLNARLASLGIDEIAGVPVLDSFATLIAHAEMLVQVAGGSERRRPEFKRPWQDLEAATASALR
jgi:allantoin racemase